MASLVARAREKQVLCIGHRGAAAHHPENSLSSIQAALDFGVDAIEIDIHHVDDQLLVFHDHRLERLTGQSGRLEDLNYAQIKELRSLGKPIPTLEEVANLVHGQVILNIEIKGQHCDVALARRIDRLQQQGWTNEQIVVSSFDHVQLQRFKALQPSIRIGMLTASQPLQLIEMAQQLDCYSIHMCNHLISQANINQAHSHGFQVYCYTVNYEDDMHQLIDMGVDGIMSDYPDRLKAVIKNRKDQAQGISTTST